MSETPLRVGVLGLGVIAPFFLEAIAADDRWTLAAVCDRDPDRTAPLHARGVRCFADAEQMFASGAVDAVVITLPNDLHAPMIARAVAHGVHVCCEKPLTVRAGEANRLAGLAAASGVALFTASHRRHNQHVIRLAETLRREDVASVVARYFENIEEHVGDDEWYLDPERCGGGCVIDNGPNALDAVRTVLGDLELTGAVLGDMRRGIEFCAELSLRTPDGIPVTVQLDWAYPGQVKDVVVRLRDGRELAADMLEGFTGLKGSLAHEYAGIMDGFAAAVADARTGRDAAADGVAVVELIERAYAVGRANEKRLRTVTKEPVASRLVKLWHHTRDDRGMTLSPWDTRCVLPGEVHELVVTTDRPRAAGDRIDRVAFLGHTEITAAGLIEKGDLVFCGETFVGEVAGFDECHVPNHLNILIAADRLVTADVAAASVGTAVRFAEQRLDLSKN